LIASMITLAVVMARKLMIGGPEKLTRTGIGEAIR
jgi:hypothetical protein